MAIPDYLQDTAKDFAKQATATYSVPIDTTTFTGRQFVAGEDPLQTSAINLAQQGVGSYQPYLTAAQANLQNMAGLTGASAYQPFMSPYQTDVIDETLRQYDLSRQAGQQSIRDAAVGSGGFGGGREGAMLGQYDADTLMNRAGLRAQMLQQGFGQAQTAAQQAFQNQQTLGSGQMGLSNFQRAGLGADVGALGQLGSLRQGITQAQLEQINKQHRQQLTNLTEDYHNTVLELLDLLEVWHQCNIKIQLLKALGHQLLELLVGS
jgi:hypothetical protein